MLQMTMNMLRTGCKDCVLKVIKHIQFLAQNGHFTSQDLNVPLAATGFIVSYLFYFVLFYYSQSAGS